MDVTKASERCESVLDAISGAVIAEREFLETVLLGVLASGHVLLEDVPGTGKTLTARSYASALGLSFSRVQFTPDLLPADVTGTHVFNEDTREFEFNEGPIFANVVLADEINRAPPKTQAALLEAMEEAQVTVDGDTHELPKPFFVIATQNPVEQEGSLHPDETLYMDGSLWKAQDALTHAKECGELVHDGEDTRMYALDATTQTLRPDGQLGEQEAMVYETDYEGQIFTVRTKTGREIRVSGNHPFLVNRSGSIQWVEARNLDEDDYLVAPDRLPSLTESFPSHDATMSELETEFNVIPSEVVQQVLAAVEADEALSRKDIDVLRVGRGWSKRDLANRAEVSYDRVLNYLQGAETDIGHELATALTNESPPTPADCVESYSIHRFEREPTDGEAGFLIGFILSDGHYTDASIAIYQSNHPEKFDHWVDIVRDLGFKVRIREMKGGREAKVDSKPLVEYLDTRYDLKTPMSLLSAPEAFRQEFLEIFLLAESHYDADRRRVTFTQKNRGLTNLIAHLMLQFGIRPWVEDHGRVYRIKIQGEDVETYLDHFEWPGDAPSVDSFDSVHRTMPVNIDEMEAIVESLGIDRDGAFSDRDWYQSFRMARSGRGKMAQTHVESFVDDVERELVERRATEVRVQATNDLGIAARRSGLAITDVVRGAGITKYAAWQAYQGSIAPADAVEFVADVRNKRTRLARNHVTRLRNLVSGDVFYDRVQTIGSEPYEGNVIGLSVPETHNYLAGLGACGINHNTFPLPEAQVDRFAVKSSIGYPDTEGEYELLRRRAGRDVQSPSMGTVLNDELVADLRQVPETVRVDDDLLEYMANVARATREDRRVSVGVSPRGTQRLFEAARARAAMQGREFVTPDDVKRVAQPVLAHRVVLTPDAQVNNVAKSAIIDRVLDEVEVPTVE